VLGGLQVPLEPCPRRSFLPSAHPGQDRCQQPQRRDLTAERNWVPFPADPGVTFADRTMCGLQADSFRWSATKPKTTSAGAPMTISPVILVMPVLTPARRDAG
jgi:hypothetical protein